MYTGQDLINAGVETVVPITSQSPHGTKLYDISVLQSNGFSLTSGQSTPDTTVDYAIVKPMYGYSTFYAVPVNNDGGTVSQIGSTYYEISGSAYDLEGTYPDYTPVASVGTFTGSPSFSVPNHTYDNSINDSDYTYYKVIVESGVTKLQQVSNYDGSTYSSSTISVSSSTIGNIPVTPSDSVTVTDVLKVLHIMVQLINTQLN